MIYELLKDRIMNGGSGSEAIIKSLSNSLGYLVVP